MSKFFEKFTAEAAKENQDALRETLSKVDQLRANIGTRDSAAWDQLKNLGYAQRIDGQREGQYRWEFNQTRYDDDAKTLSMSPESYAAWLNQGLDW